MTPGTEELPTEMGALAGKLTEAQRDWLRTGWRRNGRGYWPLRHAMIAKGLIDSSENTTALGRQVAAHLQANPATSDSKDAGRD